jgi:hypothetical protein
MLFENADDLTAVHSLLTPSEELEAVFGDFSSPPDSSLAKGVFNAPGHDVGLAVRYQRRSFDGSSRTARGDYAS